MSFASIFGAYWRDSRQPKAGITALHDVGTSVLELEGILDSYSQLIDFVKLGVGTAAVDPSLPRRLELFKAYGVPVYFGGTLFERSYASGTLKQFFQVLVRHQIEIVEVSTGSIDIPLAERARIIAHCAGDFRVFAEVGSKDLQRVMPPSSWITEIAAVMEAGAEYCVLEGRDSATAGIYRPSGEIREGLIAEIVASISLHDLIFEAPSSATQMYLIDALGPAVNLGNVNPRDALLLEAQRAGLRFETFPTLQDN